MNTVPRTRSPVPTPTPRATKRDHLIDDADRGPDRDPPPAAAALKFPGFLQMHDDELIAVIADPQLQPGESEEDLLREAAAELLKRLDARRERVAA